MRGDSLRDLYAKTLAVAGLGVLAAAGALVDYWPVGIGYPAVASAFALNSLIPAPLPVTSWAEDAPRATYVPVAAGSQDVVFAVPLLAALSAGEPTLPLGEPVPLSAQDALFSTPVPVATVVRADDRDTVEWSGDAEAGPVAGAGYGAAIAMVDSQAASGGETDGRGFVSGALTKTTSSIVRTGRWTGASIVRAVRVARGVVGRAIPD